ncbi:MAG: hypothetical protein HY055_14920 [Magnetospirillum sp.]|nr:hypothetical protein [Magnetospirillum sp.]
MSEPTQKTFCLIRRTTRFLAVLLAGGLIVATVLAWSIIGITTMLSG